MESIINVLTDEKNPKDENGITPLHLAAQGGHLEVVKAIADKLTHNKNPKDVNGKTPLHLAEEHSHLLVVEYLCFLDSNDNITADMKTIIDWAIKLKNNNAIK